MQNPLMQQKGTSESQRPTSTGTSAQSPTSEVPAFPEAQEDPVAARKRKYGTRWKQQNLRACRQNFDVRGVVILYLSLGIIFMGLAGISFFHASNYPKFTEVDYTHCRSKNKSGSASQSQNGDLECFPDSIPASENATKMEMCACEVMIAIRAENLPKSGGRLLLYVELNRLHQNVRQYRKEVDWEQLNGKAASAGVPNEPYGCKAHINRRGENKRVIFPCGKVANSYFSDKFKMFNDKGKEVQLIYEGLAWETDKLRFKNPTAEQLKNKNPEDVFDFPIDWHYGLRSEFYKENGTQNEHFIVWMRNAALDKFRKLYAFVGTDEAGDYKIEIQYRYDVKSFRGTKKIVIAADPEDRPVDFFFFQWYLGVGLICLLTIPGLFLSNCVLNAFHKSSSPKGGSQSISHSVSVADEARFGSFGIASITSSQNELEDFGNSKNSTQRASFASLIV